MRTRASNGKFSTNGPVENKNYEIDCPDKTEIPQHQHQMPSRQSYLTAKTNGTSISIPITGSGWSLLKIAIILLMLSPWLFILFKKQNVESVSRRVTDFFEENFNCPPCTPCDFMKNETMTSYSNVKKGF